MYNFDLSKTSELSNLYKIWKRNIVSFIA
ncbi:hypothetical protein F383_31891 [Gossypium arboreum]|uniref:Uncharacterized protein n=1 Tax=Gossypium arboreum TaxID=29729 RepID=A0A0B0MZV0_GOSAR|nr:hypothetical protein F383_31891 [Gossypium arboreum]